MVSMELSSTRSLVKASLFRRASSATWPSVRQSREVVESAGDELLTARILSVGGEELKQVAHLLGKLGPGRRRCGEEELLKLHLARFKGRFIELNLL